MICKNVLLFFCQYTGGLRPTRDSSGDKPLEWVVGPLVKAVEEGSVFLIDETRNKGLRPFLLGCD